MYKCLCCGNETLPVPAEEAIAYICPVCWWENDVFLKRSDEPSDENHGMTLLEARENYIKYGICVSSLTDRDYSDVPEEVAENARLLETVITKEILGFRERF